MGCNSVETAKLCHTTSLNGYRLSRTVTKMFST